MKNILFRPAPSGIIGVVASLLILASCQTQPSSENKSQEPGLADTTQPVDKSTMEKNGIKLTEVKNSPEFPEAKIGINTPAHGEMLKSGKIKFNFNVENYSLGNQTQDSESKLCANSAKGQHIHSIINNGAYTAHYENAFEKEITEDGYYVSLAFLSRSYHESIKTKNAYILTDFMVGKPTNIDTMFSEDPETGEAYETHVAVFKNEKKQQVDLKLSSNPFLFYSRPKGDYTGEKEINRLLLDFFLVNIDLSEDGYKVKAVINGTEFLLSKWCPYYIEGLPLGENKISLTLVDSEGNPVYEASPFFESGERVFTLKKDEMPG